MQLAEVYRLLGPKVISMERGGYECKRGSGDSAVENQLPLRTPLWSALAHAGVSVRPT